MKAEKRHIGILILLISILACKASQSARTSNLTTKQLIHDDIERSYLLYIPASVDASKPSPLLIALHGGTGNGNSMMVSSGFNQIAEEQGFIVAYPDGAGRLEDKLLTWNGGTCCGYAQQANVDDVGFIRAVVADIQTRAAVDTKRIYATGMSNGGIMSYRLACEAADLFAAIAPVSGTLNFSPCNPSENVSVIDFHGTADQHIPYEGGFGPESLVNVNFESVMDSVQFWVSMNECSSQSTTTSDDIQHDTWTGCSENSSVELYTIINGGHAWPGGGMGWPGSDRPTDTISASRLIWEFFASHPKP